jgi:hypothetical protein
VIFSFVSAFFRFFPLLRLVFFRTFTFSFGFFLRTTTAENAADEVEVNPTAARPQLTTIYPPRQSSLLTRTVVYAAVMSVFADLFF